MLTSVGDGVLTFAKPEAPDRMESIAFDDLVTISGNVSNDALCDELRDGPWQLRAVGDAVGPRFLEAATWEGNQAIGSFETGWVRPAMRFGQTGSAM